MGTCPSERVRASSCEALGIVNAASPEIISTLASRLEDASHKVHLAAVCALHRLNVGAVDAVPAVLKYSVANERDDIRLAGLRMLSNLMARGAMGRHAGMVTGAMRRFIGDSNEEVAKEARLCLSFQRARAEISKSIEERAAN